MSADCAGERAVSAASDEAHSAVAEHATVAASAASAAHAVKQAATEAADESAAAAAAPAPAATPSSGRAKAHGEVETSGLIKPSQAIKLEQLHLLDRVFKDRAADAKVPKASSSAKDAERVVANAQEADESHALSRSALMAKLNRMMAAPLGLAPPAVVEQVAPAPTPLQFQLPAKPVRRPRTHADAPVATAEAETAAQPAAGDAFVMPPPPPPQGDAFVMPPPPPPPQGDAFVMPPPPSTQDDSVSSSPAAATLATAAAAAAVAADLVPPPAEVHAEPVPSIPSRPMMASSAAAAAAAAAAHGGVKQLKAACWDTDFETVFHGGRVAVQDAERSSIFALKKEWHYRYLVLLGNSLMLFAHTYTEADADPKQKPRAPPMTARPVLTLSLKSVRAKHDQYKHDKSCIVVERRTDGQQSTGAGDAAEHEEAFRFHAGLVGDAAGGLYAREQGNALWLQWITNRCDEMAYVHACERHFQATDTRLIAYAREDIRSPDGGSALDLAGRALSVHAQELLFAALSQRPLPYVRPVSHLSLARAELTRAQQELLISALQQTQAHCPIVSLDLSFNRLAPDTARALLTALATFAHVRSLVLQKCFEGASDLLPLVPLLLPLLLTRDAAAAVPPRATIFAAQAVASAAASSTVSADGGGGIGDAAAAAAPARMRSPLFAAHESAAKQAAEARARTLYDAASNRWLVEQLHEAAAHGVPRQAGDLLRLDLSECGVSDAVLMQLCDAMHAQLTQVCGGGSGNSTAGAVHADSWRCSLHSLWLDANDLGDASAQRLADLMAACAPHMATVRRISLAKNARLQASGGAGRAALKRCVFGGAASADEATAQLSFCSL